MYNLNTTLNKIRILVLLSFLNFSVIAQSNGTYNPPTNVEAAFKERFPAADKIKWENVDNDKKEFIASFSIDKMKLRAYFDKNGNWVETEKEIDSKELPEKVMLSIKTQYPNDKILKAFEIEKAKTKLYEVVLKTEDAKTSLVVSKDGYFTSR